MKKAVSGDDYVAANERYQKKKKKKALREMSTPGIANELKYAEMKKSYSNLPSLKGQRK